jgi:parvulin-like peptidyl-prolyl isomerase
MTRSTSWVFILSLICFSNCAFAKQVENKPLAKYGNHQITEEDLNKFYQESRFSDSLNGKQLKDLPVSMKKGILEMYLKRMVLEDAAKESKIEKTEEYKKEFQIQSKAFLISSFLQQKIQKRLTDEAIEASYRNMIKNLQEKGEIRLQYLFFASNEQANAAVSKMRSGKTFADVYRDAPKENKSPKSLSTRYLGPWDIFPQILVEKSYALSALQHSEAIPTEHGCYIVQVLEKRAVKQLPSFSEVQYQIKERLGSQYREELEANLMKQAKVKFFE